MSLDDQVGAEAFDAVSAVLVCWERVNDPVVGSRQQLVSGEAAQRMRGLSVLASLPQAFPADDDGSSSEAEVSAARVVVDLCVGGEGRGYAERGLAYKVVGVLSFRMGYSGIDVLTPIIGILNDLMYHSWASPLGCWD